MSPFVEGGKGIVVLHHALLNYQKWPWWYEDSDRLLAWIGPCATSRVVAIQLGHGPAIFSNPEYRTMVHNAILWSAGRLK